MGLATMKRYRPEVLEPTATVEPKPTEPVEPTVTVESKPEDATATKTKAKK